MDKFIRTTPWPFPYNKAMAYRIGIDAGSKTIKAVILDDDGSTAYAMYRRHRANISETMREIMHDMIWRYGDMEGHIAVTGSAGIEVARILNVPFVQEVVATTFAVQQQFPEADAFIELGGEDAKVVYLTGGLEQRMNATCAGGTGGFIDTIAFMLGVRSQEMSTLALGANRIYPIASRCAVFAQTDVRPLLNSGAKKSDIAASVLEAVVKQTIGGLACGRPIRGTVVFLGGPLEHIPDLVFRFRRALGLTHKTGIKPADAHLFTARGTALLSVDPAYQAGYDNFRSLSEIESALASTPAIDDAMARLAPLFENEEERAEFTARHAATRITRRRLQDCTGNLYLGIDAGSTTVKLALIDEDAALVYSDYRPVKGDVLETAKTMMDELYGAIPHDYAGNLHAHIAHASVTGYGEDLLRSALNADSGLVETLAHFRGAVQLCPEADFVLDIGGQDIKALWIRNGAIENAVLNEACSSGCGSFIEGTAYSLRFTPYSFSDIALSAEAPVDLGMKCTVFMTSRVRHAQKIGVPYADIAAGLAYSVVENALFKIIGMNNLDELGETVVVQGGAFMSDAVLRAFELVSGKQVIRPDIAHLMGAYGAALTARMRADGGPSNLLSREQLAALQTKKSMQRCPGCTNACLLTVIEFKDGENEIRPGRIHISGNRCEKAYGALSGIAGFVPSGQSGVDAPAVKAKRPPNLYALEQRLIRRYSTVYDQSASKTDRSDVHIGLPQTLHLYEQTPFWNTLFGSLGLSVHMPPGPGVAKAGDQAHGAAGSDGVCDPFSTGGLETVPSESVCYPAKITHGHISALIRDDVDAVFMPRYVRGRRCAVSSLYADAVRDSVPEFSQEEVRLVSPELKSMRLVNMAENDDDRTALFEALKQIMPAHAPLGREEFATALRAALDAQREFESLLQDGAERTFKWMQKNGGRGIVLAGRPYHADEEVSHRIDVLLTELGFAVFSPQSLNRRLLLTEKDFEAEDGTDTWRQARTLKRLARFTLANPSLDFVFLHSFGCSYDALSIDSLRPLFEKAGRVFTDFKIDEIVDLAHVRIRLRTLAETLEGATSRSGSDRTASAGEARALAATDGEGMVLDVDDSKDCYAAETRGSAAECKDEACSEKSASAKAIGLGALEQADIASARAYVSHDICIAASAMAGRIINLAEQDPDVCIKVPEVCLSCLLDALPDMVRHAKGHCPPLEFIHTWETPMPPETKMLSNIECTDGKSGKQVGILGNALMCFDGLANRGLIDLIEELGFEAVLPDPETLFVDDVSYRPIIEEFLSKGIETIIYVQAFGCLKGHIESRGALRALQKDFPKMHLTVIDYDYDTSTLNQENRIRLALA